ncbi:3-deoxy-D-manno-octulosonic acid transferase [Candidatus Providencia siddallii]|uniref:3-deoxy-D-manno-octulosonic acid transferase n=1 Tax=Candidatus Providencia siddallii TaxID=1715285 RepID=A0A0M6W7Y8_9GAMM|nr:3-deoxy-D-manno-octulosonic acid transferase [Candidatus Providencia siddallii]
MLLMFLYQLIFYIIQPFIWFRLLLRAYRSPDYLKRIKERYGFCFGKVVSKGVLIHSVSIGETFAIVYLVRLLRDCYPLLPITITTSTLSSSKLVFSIFGSHVNHVYLPYDLQCSMRRFINLLNPKLVIFVEKEIWPNMINQLYQKKIPIIIINARLSEHSLAKYQKISIFIKYILYKITMIFAQSKEDGERFVRLGFNPVKLRIVENVKFDISITNELITSSIKLRNQLASSRHVWIAASTHEGEEIIILDIYKKLLENFPDLLLILVPRNPDRFDKVKELTQKKMLKFVLRSTNKIPTADIHVLIGDSINELMLLYGIADIAFVGGSLVKIGGHNPLEPAAHSLPIIMGPYIYNFKNICEKLIKYDGLILVKDWKSMLNIMINLLSNKSLRVHHGKCAAKVLHENQGVSSKILKLLHPYLL